MEIWERRRRNLAALMAFKGMNAKQVAEAASLSVNTVGKFLRGDTKSMTHATLDRVCLALGISNAAILDSENPLSVAKDRLFAKVAQMSEEEAQRALLLLDKDPTD